MATAETTQQDALAVARLFIEAFNQRDVDALNDLVTDDAEFRKYSREDDALHGREAVEALVNAAEAIGLQLVSLKGGSVEPHGDHAHVTVPVRELIGPDDIERAAEFKVQDGRIAAFTVRPLGG